MDDFQILGLTYGASRSEVRKAYKKEALKMSPDRKGNEEKFKILHEAFQRIMDAYERDENAFIEKKEP